MKKILFVMCLLISGATIAQKNNRVDLIDTNKADLFGAALGVTAIGSYIPGLAGSAIEIRSTYDTTVLYSGIPRLLVPCIHTFATEIQRNPLLLSSCALLHDAAGCPDTWGSYNIICTKCLRHLHIQETRTIQKAKDPYNEAVEQLNKLQH